MRGVRVCAAGVLAAVGVMVGPVGAQTRAEATPANLGAHGPADRSSGGAGEVRCEFKALPLTLYTNAGQAPEFDYFLETPARGQFPGMELAVEGDIRKGQPWFTDVTFTLRDSRFSTVKLASVAIMLDGRDTLLKPTPRQWPTSTPGRYEARTSIGLGDKGSLLLGPWLAQSKSAQVKVYDAAGGLVAASQTIDVSSIRLIGQAIAAANYSCN